jgi:hypothetical protein
MFLQGFCILDSQHPCTQGDIAHFAEAGSLWLKNKHSRWSDHRDLNEQVSSTMKGSGV